MLKKWNVRLGVLWRHQELIFPLCFVFQPLLRFAFFQLGLGYEDNILRHSGLMIGFALFALFCGLVWLSVLREDRPPIRVFLLWGAVLGFFVICFFISFIKFGLHPEILYYAAGFISMSLPAFFAGIYGALRSGERTFFSSIESFSFLAIPTAVMYTNSMLFNCPGWGWGNMGAMDYMMVAYSFMPFLLSHTIGLVDQAEWVLPFSGKAVPHRQLFRTIFIAVYWVGIIATGTRGTYFCVTGFCLLLVLFRLIYRDKSVKRACQVSAAVILLLAFNLFVYAPPGLQEVTRMQVFFDGLKQGQLSTASADNLESEQIAELVNKDDGQTVISPPQTDPTPGNPSTSEDPSTPEENPPEEPIDVGNRGTLFLLAIQEFQKQPLLGMGPGGFTVKYEMYPHTACLELLCETGLVGTLLLMSLLLYAIFLIIRFGKDSLEIRNMFLFFAAYAIQANISGSLWMCSALLCALGYGLTLSARRIFTDSSVNQD